MKLNYISTESQDPFGVGGGLNVGQKNIKKLVSFLTFGGLRLKSNTTSCAPPSLTDNVPFLSKIEHLLREFVMFTQIFTANAILGGLDTGGGRGASYLGGKIKPLGVGFIFWGVEFHE